MDKLTTIEDLKNQLKQDNEGKHDTIVKLSDVKFEVQPFAGNEREEMKGGQRSFVSMKLKPGLVKSATLPEKLDFDYHNGQYRAWRKLVGILAAGSGLSARAVVAHGPRMAAAILEYWQAINGDKDVLFRWREPGTGPSAKLTEQVARPYTRTSLPATYATYDNLRFVNDIEKSFASEGLQFAGATVRDYSMDARLVLPEATNVGTSRKRDDVFLGLCVGNSETGDRNVTIDAMVYRLICTNGMIDYFDGQRLCNISHTSSNVASVSDTLDKACEKLVAKKDDLLNAYISAKDVRVSDPQPELQRILQFGGVPATLHELVIETFNNVYAPPAGVSASRWDVMSAITEASQRVDDADMRVRMDTIAGTYARHGLQGLLSSRQRLAAQVRRTNDDEDEIR